MTDDWNRTTLTAPPPAPPKPPLLGPTRLLTTGLVLALLAGGTAGLLQYQQHERDDATISGLQHQRTRLTSALADARNSLDNVRSDLTNAQDCIAAWTSTSADEAAAMGDLNDALQSLARASSEAIDGDYVNGLYDARAAKDSAQNAADAINTISLPDCTSSGDGA